METKEEWREMMMMIGCNTEAIRMHVNTIRCVWAYRAHVPLSLCNWLIQWSNCTDNNNARNAFLTYLLVCSRFSIIDFEVATLSREIERYESKSDQKMIWTFFSFLRLLYLPCLLACLPEWSWSWCWEESACNDDANEVKVQVDTFLWFINCHASPITVVHHH